MKGKYSIGYIDTKNYVGGKFRKIIYRYENGIEETMKFETIEKAKEYVIQKLEKNIEYSIMKGWKIITKIEVVATTTK